MLTQDHKHEWTPIPGMEKFPQRLCICGSMKVGSNTVLLGDSIRYTSTKPSTVLGEIGMDLATGRPSAFVGGMDEPLALASEAAGSTPPPDATVVTGSGLTGSATHILVPGLTITPGAGTYLVWYTGQFWNTTGGAGVRRAICQIFANSLAQGTEIPGEESPTPIAFSRIAKVTVADAQAIEGRFRHSTGASSANVDVGILAISRVT